LQAFIFHLIPPLLLQEKGKASENAYFISIIKEPLSPFSPHPSRWLSGRWLSRPSPSGKGQANENAYFVSILKELPPPNTSIFPLSSRRGLG